jgi:hypothetical protein
MLDVAATRERYPAPQHDQHEDRQEVDRAEQPERPDRPDEERGQGDDRHQPHPGLADGPVDRIAFLSEELHRAQRQRRRGAGGMNPDQGDACRRGSSDICCPEADRAAVSIPPK